MTRIFPKVVAFEPNEEVTRDLARCGALSLTIHHCALSSTGGTRDLHIPLADGRAHTGWASFDKGRRPGSDDFRVLKVPLRRLDDFGLEGVSLIKMDVTGHGLEVLQGGRRRIEASRPVVITQITTEERSVLARHFGELGYFPHVASGGRLRFLDEGVERYVNEREFLFIFMPVRETTSSHSRP